MLAKSALAVAAFKCSVGITHLLAQTGTRAWARHTRQGPRCPFFFPWSVVFLVQWSDQMLVLGVL